MCFMICFLFGKCVISFNHHRTDQSFEFFVRKNNECERDTLSKNMRQFPLVKYEENKNHILLAAHCV